MAETDRSTGEQGGSIELPNLPEGLSAIPFPNINDADQRKGEPVPPTLEVAMDRLNGFLSALNSQGADIVTVLDINVMKDTREHGIALEDGLESMMRTMGRPSIGSEKIAIIRKASKAPNR